MIEHELADGVAGSHRSIVIRLVNAAFLKLTADAVFRRALLKRLRAVRPLLVRY